MGAVLFDPRSGRFASAITPSIASIVANSLLPSRYACADNPRERTSGATRRSSWQGEYVLEFLVKSSLFLLVVHYIGYPVVVIALARLRGAGATAQSAEADVPTVCFIIAAYNEQRVIEEKLHNTLSLDYPPERLRIIVASQGSTDATPEIARSFEPHGVLVLHDPRRGGKTAALNEAVSRCSSEIIIFSDANNAFERSALRRLVAHFVDPMVGGVTGLKQIRAADDRESSVGDGLYWAYESAIKSAESALGSITAADGEIFAMRRELFRPMDPTLINDDAALTLDIVQSGRRLVYEPAAKSFEDASITIGDDFNVKVRMVSGGFQTLERNWRYLFSPGTRFAWQFFCHKTLRWIGPELLIILFLASATQLHQPRYAALFWMQVAFYALALGGLFLRSGTKPLPKLLYVPFYFCAMNAAAFMGLYRYLTGTTVWKKAAR